MARLLEGHERGGAAAERPGERRAQLGVIVALFHDAGYIRKSEDEERHGAQLKTADARRRRGSPYLRTNVIARLLRRAPPRVLMMAPHA